MFVLIPSSCGAGYIMHYPPRPLQQILISFPYLSGTLALLSPTGFQNGWCTIPSCRLQTTTRSVCLPTGGWLPPSHWPPSPAAQQADNVCVLVCG